MAGHSALPDLSRVVGPMVNQSDAPFRALCIKYGATCTFSEMLFSTRIVNEDSYLNAYIPDCDAEIMQHTSREPLVVQICGNDPPTLGQAVSKICETGRAWGIDLNLGCPQDRAKDDLFGSFLLDKCHWELVFSCVKAMSDAAAPFQVPIFCKIRLIEGANSIELTKQFCRGLCANGCRAITIHGRTRGSTKHRRAGRANLNAVAEIASEFARDGVPVISNGNIRCAHDLEGAIVATSTSCSGVMSAEGLLRNPTLFATHLHMTEEEKKKVNDHACKDMDDFAEGDGFYECQRCNDINRRESIPDMLTLFKEYAELSERYRDIGGWEGMDEFERSKREESRQIYIARQHLIWMLGKSGHGRTIRFKNMGSFYRRHCDLAKDVNEASTLEALTDIAERCLRGRWT